MNNIYMYSNPLISMVRRFYFIPILIAFIIFGFAFYVRKDLAYDLNKPARSFPLPLELSEISGISYESEDVVSCVNDEFGIIYHYNLEERKIVKKINVTDKGDFEGIAKYSSDVFMLRSEGVLYKVSHGDAPNVKVINLDLKTRNNEGLCFDPVSKQMLIASKVKMVKEKDNRDIRLIYQFDPSSLTLKDQPFMSFSVNSIDKYFNKAGSEKSSKGKGGKPSNKDFMPSEIAVNPLDQNIYLLSAVAQKLVVLNRSNQIVKIYTLDPSLFTQPEGMFFKQDGTLFISNEAAGKIASLLEFKPIR